MGGSPHYQPYLQGREMNVAQGYGGVQQQQQQHGYASGPHQQHHMATPPMHTPTSMSSYASQYQHPPPLLQPAANNYTAAYTHFPNSYGTPVTSSPAAGGHNHGHGHGHGHYSHPSITLPTPMTGLAVGAHAPQDTTGQTAPPSSKPKVTATLWEDEDTLCFQVEVGGICVARREDNHMINGTKLLNVTGMTRGRRDGILKSEKDRSVIKVGPMHLKGVWIPFERALEFANREKIADSLYPLFVNNIGSLIVPPHNQTTASARRPASQNQSSHQRTPSSATSVVAPMANPVSSYAPQTPHSVAPYTGRPGLDRAQTFPTPPTSATSGMGQSGSSYAEWPHGQSQVNPVEDRTRSLPTTPATTPPETTLPTLQPYSASQSFDSQKSSYSAPQQQYQHVPQHVQFPQYAPMAPHHYVKHEMAPPSRNAHDLKDDETNQEYAHNNMAYGGADRSYASLLPHEQHAGLKTSPTSQQHPAGRATPRAFAAPHNAWPTYSAPQRSQTLPSAGLTYDTRYSAIPPATNQAYGYPSGVSTQKLSNKRGRDTEDEDENGHVRLSSSHGVDDTKRRKIEGLVPRPRSTLIQRR